MATASPASPYDSHGIDEVHLDKAPLVRVLAQIRHPQLYVLAGERGQDAALKVAEHLHSQYPIFQPERQSGFVLTPDGIQEKSDFSSVVWHLKDGDETWQVTFGSEFISLDTSTYLGRQDFYARLITILEVYAREIRPENSVRIGVRYTNRVDDPGQLEELPRLTKPELVGPIGIQLPENVELAQFYSQAQFTDPDGGLLLQWGMIPSNRIFDVSIGGIPRPSWFLDIDAFSSTKVPFEPTALAGRVRDLAARAYTSFRWAVTEEFLTTFKGA